MAGAGSGQVGSGLGLGSGPKDASSSEEGAWIGRACWECMWHVLHSVTLIPFLLT